VEGISSSLDRDIPPGYSPVVFRDVTQEAGIDFLHFPKVRSTQLPEDMGPGVAWGDFDNDGYPDLYLCNLADPENTDPSKSQSGNRLYRNRGDGSFEDVTEHAGVGFIGSTLAAAWADYDGDGNLDLWLSNYGTNRIYRNHGDGTFSDATHEAGLGDIEGFWTGASWGDYDLDGDLDLYVCGYVQYRFDEADLARSTLQYQAAVPFSLNPSSFRPERNLLYRNNGNGTFSEVAAQARVDNTRGRSLAAAWADFDLDGRLDLYVANDISDNAMYRNLGDGRFEDISHQVWVADYRGAMGIGIGDWDNDLDLDIFVTHWIAQENALYNNLTFAFDNREGPPAKLLFMDVADQNGLGQIATDYIGWGTSFFDFDNDGRLDLFVSNGSTFQEEQDPTRLVPMRSLLFWNGGEEEGFYEVGEVSGEFFNRKLVGRGAALADYDNDGDLDIAFVNNQGPAVLLRNENPTGHWLKVRLIGLGSNRFALGARVQIKAGTLRQLHQVGSQPSYLSQNSPEVHIGLGPEQVVDSLTVTFLSGREVTLTDLPSDQTVTVSEEE